MRKCSEIIGSDVPRRVLAITWLRTKSPVETVMLTTATWCAAPYSRPQTA